MVGISIGGKPLAGFDQPIELLKDCHRRIEHFLGVLQKVVALFGDSELPEEGRRALATALDYFAHAAPRHTADEEESLFPRLSESGDAEAQSVLAELERLAADHRRAEACHAQVEELGREWLQSGRIAPSNRAAMNGLLDELVALYAAHIRLEEDRVFDVAAKVLKPGELSEVGVEMQRRRIEPCRAG